MVGIKPREKEEVIPTTEKSKTFGTVSAKATKAKQYEEQVTHGATVNQEKTISLELGDLMAKLGQIDKKLKSSEEDRQELKSEIRYNKNDNLDNCFNLVKGDGREATADVRQGGGYRQRARETYQERYGRNEETVGHRDREVMESRYQNGYNGQGTS